MTVRRRVKLSGQLFVKAVAKWILLYETGINGLCFYTACVRRGLRHTLPKLFLETVGEGGVCESLRADI